MEESGKIYVAGHNGMVGSAVVRALRDKGFRNIIGRSSRELDLTCQGDVERFFAQERPEYVFLAAARVGGIMANSTYRAEFIYTNLQIQNNVLHFAWKYGVRKLLFFSSSCIYPRGCPQPMREEHLWSAQLEVTNEPYAVAKLAGMSMCRAYHDQYRADFISAIPTNLYGPNDNFDPSQSHVVAGMILRMHAAKLEQSPRVELWGTGTPRRELMYVDDAADAALFLMQNYTGGEPVNVGVGADHSIRELAAAVREAVGYRGELVFDASKPDGVPQKLLDGSRLQQMGWRARHSLEEGIAMAYQWFLQSTEYKQS